MDRIDCMRVFVEVVDSGSFSAAARKLDLSRALVSKRMAAFENVLGTRLFNRTTRRLSLTGPGAEFLVSCRRILDELDAATDALRTLQTEPRGLMRINAPMSFGRSHLAAAVAGFMLQYPELRIQMTLNDRFVDLVEEGYDIAIRIGQLQDSSLTARLLATADLAVCAAPAYLQRHGIPATPEDLARHRLLHYGYATSGMRWRFEGPDGPRTVTIDPLLSINNGDALVVAATHGLGIIMQPLFIAEPALADGHLVRILPQYGARPVPVHALWPSNRLQTRNMRAFIDHLVDWFARNPI